jgi:tRNA(Arg) A34 adenosine deaminase TadA
MKIHDINHEDKMAEASNLATYSVGIGGGPFGAIVVDNSSGIIVGRGHNQVTLKPMPK